MAIKSFLSEGGFSVGSVGSTPVDVIDSAGNISAATISGSDLTLSGNLIVNGSTVTVNSTVTTLDDPILTLGGDTAPASNDTKDRGVEFRWHNGSTAKVGFFGYDNSTGKLTFVPDATNSSEIFSGTVGTIDLSGSAAEVRAHISSGTGISFSSGTITNTGVLSITGTSNQVTASASTGAITLSLPQNIDTGATPTFSGINAGTGTFTSLTSSSTTTLNGTTIPASSTLLVSGGALGTPSSGTVTNLTGTASININGTVGATTPSTGAFTTLSASDAITMSDKGIRYLQGVSWAESAGFLTNKGAILSQSSASNPAVVLLSTTGGPSQAVYFGSAARGTLTALSPTQQFDGWLAVLRTYGGSTWANSARLEMFADGTHSETSRPSYIAFHTTAVDSVTNTERMRIDSAGNVGVGTGSPTRKLTVSGAVAGTDPLNQGDTHLLSLENTDATDGNVIGLVFSGYDSGATRRNPAGIFSRFSNRSAGGMSGTLGFWTKDGTGGITERMTITPSGNVGIGTSSPAAKLHVAGGWTRIDTGSGYGFEVRSGAAGSRMQFTSEGGDGYSTINVTNNADSAYAGLVVRSSNFQFVTPSGTTMLTGLGIFSQFLQAAGSNSLILGGGYGSHVTINASGNVGIGASPYGTGTKMSVSGRTLIKGGSESPGDSSGAGLSLSYDTVNNIANISSVATGVAGYRMNIGGNPTVFLNSNTGAERMRITSSGNVLIGTTTDSANGRLQLTSHTTSAGGIGFGTDVSLYRSGTYTLNLAGYLVAVSPEDYGSGLAVKSNNNAGSWARMDFVNVNADGTTLLYQNQAGKFDIRNESTNSVIAFVTKGAVERMRVNGDGNVGIGTSSPGAGLEVYNRQIRINSSNGLYARIEHANAGSLVWSVGTQGNATDYNIYRESGGGSVYVSNSNFNISNGQLYLGGVANQISKNRSSRTDIPCGELDANSPFWTGIHYSTPDAFLISGTYYFPRTSFYWNYPSTTSTSGVVFNMKVGNTGLTNGGLSLGVIDGSGGVEIVTANTARLSINSAGTVSVANELVTPLIYKYKTSFTPTTVGWYRIISYNGAQASGRITVQGSWDGGHAGMVFEYVVRGYGQDGHINIVRQNLINGGIITNVRISSDGGALVYVDLYVNSATSPSLCTVYAEPGPYQPALVASPVVGAVAGSTDVFIAKIDNASAGFYTTGSIAIGANGASEWSHYMYYDGSGNTVYGSGSTGKSVWLSSYYGTNTIKFGDHNNNSPWMTLSAGNVGIGTTSPGYRVDVVGNGSVDAVMATRSRRTSNYLVLYAGASDDAAGEISFERTGASAGNVYVGGNATGHIDFRSGGYTSRMRITSAGWVGINTTAPDAHLHVVGSIVATGTITENYSDERLKTKLGPIDNPIEKIKALSGFYFEPNETAVALGYKKKREVGVSAQEVQAVLPEIVVPAPIDNQYMTVHYQKLIPLLIESIKEQQKQIEELRALITNK